MAHHLIKDAQKALPKKSAAELPEFIEKLFVKIPPEDMDLLDPITVARVAEDQWDLTRKRKAGEPAIHIYTPTLDKDDWSIGRTIINIVHEDRAFLIDSVVTEIVRHNQLIHMLLHPVLHVEQKNAVKISGMHVEPGENTHGIAVMHIQIRGALSDDQCEELEMGLRQVITDVDFANRDWLEMRSKLRQAEKELNNAPKRFNDHVIEEYQAFLEYLHDNNFTLLGYREYKFEEKGGTIVSKIIKGSSLGLLRDEVQPVYLNEARQGLSEPQQKLRRDQGPLTIAKVNKRSTVHRRVPLDAVAVKIFDKKGMVTGEILFIGLFTSVTYSRSVGDIPYLRLKVQYVLNKSEFLGGSHDRKALRHILEKYPRDEVLQIPEDDLFKHAISILRLQERPRIALYTRPDPFGRYISCLIYVPRERYETRLRLKFQHILEQELGGTCASFQVTQDDSPLARVIFWIDINHLAKIPPFKPEKIELLLEEAGRIWAERLRNALDDALEDEKEITTLAHKYGQAFPISYHERYAPKQAVYDIEKIETVLENEKIGLDLYKPNDVGEHRLRLKVYHYTTPITLSDVLPLLENMGLRVIAELPFEIQPARVRNKVWIHDFLLEVADKKNPVEIDKVKKPFEEALTRIWQYEMESDNLNKLVLYAQMNWREITILRTYVHYLRQIRYPFSRPYMEGALTAYPDIAQAIVKLFKSLHDPANQKDADTLAAGCAVEIDHQMEKVIALDHDRILRSITAVVEATLRTNFFQTDENGKHKTHLSIKLDSKKVPDIPEPKPYREIFVYSRRVEGIHLRGDKIARGGIRWSDRHEDYRTEILGLMKAQQVKNAVIVPMGAKGGFVVRHPPTEGGREAFLKEGIECYKILIRGLLDITDNLHGETVIPPKDVVRRDEDDPYLVVAADKGTASFSDIANALSVEYGFWLGDAFASGGSAGYDHKKMGITARGAWESVKRHFRELNHDTQTQEFDVIGVGDMAGDVFGNGMLLSEKICLVGAFNHIHIFCDPEPDPDKSFKERKRLFEAVQGWDAYDKKKLSKGGRIYLRSDKSLELTPEIKARFGLERDKVTPNELIQAMLRARTDLLWFGGIGTYLKASSETHADVGDKSNDALRINGNEVHARVIGEGANLAVTQLARIEYAESGGRLNADYIDNSGGVDSSDHEVNIKILLVDVMRKSKYSMDTPKRNKLLESMTEDIIAHVLRNNYQQAQGISLAELQAAESLSIHAALISDLERKMGLNRKLEGLPDDEKIAARLRTGKGLTRPELSVLQSYAKISYTRDFLKSDIPESNAMEGRLLKYFPNKLSTSFKPEIMAHKLRREIIATTLANSMVNRMGPAFVAERMEKHGVSCAEVAKAYIIVREAFGMRDIWNKIEAMDNQVPAQVQLKALRETALMIERAVVWFLSRLGRNLDINKDIAKFEDGIKQVKDNLDNVVTEDLANTIRQLTRFGVDDGLPPDLAHDISLMPILGSACDIIRISMTHKTEIPVTARVYFELGEHFHLDWMRHQARFLPTDDRWSTEALEGLIDQLYSCQAGMTIRILKDMHKDLEAGKLGKNGKDSVLHAWISSHGQQATLLEPLFYDLRHNASVDLPMLVIAEQRLRNLYGG